MEKRIYKPLEKYNITQIKDILLNGAQDQLLLLPLSLGEYCNRWKFAQDICITLMTHESAAVRANAALGLSYIARKHKRLDKSLVKPYLLKELRENTEYRWRIIDAINDINMFLGWRLGRKEML